jgi:cytoskeletal protein CcmA (bactofilin family)
MSDKNGIPTGKHTLVEEGTDFKGTLSSKCPIVVMGKVEGEVTGPVIHVTPTGVVAGNVKVKELRSEGELAGEVEAEAVRIAGRVRDKTVIRARTLQVSLQATGPGMEVVFGECELAIGDEPSKEAATTLPDAKKPDPARRHTPSEMSWNEASTSPKPATDVAGEEPPGRRKRTTQSPPV